MPVKGGTNGGGYAPGGYPSGVSAPGYQVGASIEGSSLALSGASGASGKILERIHSLSYHATDHKLLLDIEAEQTVGSVKTDKVGAITITNSGGTPSFAILAYRLWTTATAMSATTYHLNYLLKPGESLYVPDTMAVVADETVEQLAGTAVTNAAPDSNEYTDSTADVDSATADGIVGHATSTRVYLEPYTSAANCTANLFRVGDLIRVRNEVMEVTAIGDKSDLANNYLDVKRDMYGTDGGTSAVDDDPVRLPFFNAYHDFDKYSVAQTDSNGKFKCFNYFGQGRAATNLQGITPGSVAIKFYNTGYQSLGLSGIAPSSDTSLTAGGSYWFKIAIDGGTAEAINFTVDSSNTNWGGTNGVLSKINTALEDKYNNSASNTFQQRSSVGIVNGDVRFTSGQGLSTSAIALTAGTDGASASYNIFAQQNGHIPALANVPDAVAARLPDDVDYDSITYESIPNTSVFMYDDGYGNLFGSGTGRINYETGAIDFTGPVNSEFVVSCLHTSAFSGKQNATDTAKMNTIKAIYGNVPNQKWNGELTITRT